MEKRTGRMRRYEGLLTRDDHDWRRLADQLRRVDACIEVAWARTLRVDWRCRVPERACRWSETWVRQKSPSRKGTRQ